MCSMLNSEHWLFFSLQSSFSKAWWIFHELIKFKCTCVYSVYFTIGFQHREMSPTVRLHSSAPTTQTAGKMSPWQHKAFCKMYLMFVNRILNRGTQDSAHIRQWGQKCLGNMGPWEREHIRRALGEDTSRLRLGDGTCTIQIKTCFHLGQTSEVSAY